jgi:UDP-N-acetylglucosamine/UDP-N-acetyl-alpha-D-glucosaminouronate 4-epimerase
MNVACGERISLNQVVEQLREILDRTITPLYEPERPGDIKHSLAGIELAEQVLGYRPSVTFREGLARTAQAFVDQPLEAGTSL